MPSQKHQQAWESWEDMPIDEFRKRRKLAEEKTAAFVAEIDALLPGLVTLTRQQRKLMPRLREECHPMYQKIIDVTEQKPALFESLADLDEGVNPAEFESGLLRERIEKHQAFVELDQVLSPIAGSLNDTGHYLAGRFYGAVMAAYRIARTHARTDKGINDVLAPVIDWMSENAVAAAATRAAKKKGKEAPNA